MNRTLAIYAPRLCSVVYEGALRRDVLWDLPPHLYTDMQSLLGIELVSRSWSGIFYLLF